MDAETALAVTFGLVILAGAVIIISGMRYRSRAMEMAHRERLAMIERGMTPAADLGTAYQERQSARGSRSMSLGIVIVALGFALALLIGFASREGEIAIGVGGAIAVIGFAFIVNAMVVHRQPKEDDFYTTSRPVIDRSVVPPAVDRHEPPAI
jgi:uncharacterized membrane protein (DUF485 family)